MVKENEDRQHEQVIPVLRDVVEPGVRTVDQGGVRIHKSVSVQQEQLHLHLRQEEVTVTRVPVDRIVAVADAPAARQEGDTLIVPVLEEVLVVEKRLRIKEEIHITRTARMAPWRSTVPVRSEHVAIEPLAPDAPAQATSTNGGTHHATHTDRRI